MTKRTKRILVAIASAFLLLVVVAVGFLWYLIHSFDQAFNAGQYPHRPDAEMISNFNEHRQEFELIRTMAETDKEVSRIDENWTDPENLDPNKIAEYRRLFAVIGTPRGISKYQERVELIASSLGWVASGSAKGYTYATNKPTNGYFADSLDDPEVLTSQARYIKHIDGNWYLFFER